MKKIKLIIFFIVFICFSFKKTNDIIYTKIDGISKYIDYGIIEIPKINLRKQFYNNSNVDKNIIVIDSPKKYKNSILILAAHSGNASNSYFDKLHYLNIDDFIYIRNNNKKYVYVITNIYYQNKTGKIDIYTENNKKVLVLITCTNGNKNTQTVYISELV